MTDDELLELEDAERKRLLGLFRQTNEDRFLAAAQQLRTKSSDIATLLAGARTPRGRGRPTEDGDDRRVSRMAMLLAKGQARTLTEAARMEAANEPLHRRASVEKRLRNAYHRRPHAQGAARAMLAMADEIKRAEQARDAFVDMMRRSEEQGRITRAAIDHLLGRKSEN